VEAWGKDIEAWFEPSRQDLIKHKICKGSFTSLVKGDMMKNVLLGLALLFLVACTVPSEKVSDPDALAGLDTMQEAVAVDDMEQAHADTMEAGLIAGDVSKYYDWDKAKFDQAIAEDKTIYLEFAANWCSSCKVQEAHLKAAFEELDDPNVIGFKIHYNDDETTAEHKALAKKYQVPYQMTKIILKDGEVVLKSPAPWEATRFLEEMRKLQ